jgi:hypothetical protein
MEAKLYVDSPGNDDAEVCMRKYLIAMLVACALPVHAQSPHEPKEADKWPGSPLDLSVGLSRVVTSSKGGKDVVVALLDMNKVESAADLCSAMVGLIKIEGVQYNSDGSSLELIRFIDRRGNQWSVPTNLDGLIGEVPKEEANNFIRVGRTYYVRLQLCGVSGNNVSLIDLYNPSLRFGQ